MKTFSDLLEEVVEPGYCHHCGGCVSFCTAINYGALELDPDGKPRFADAQKCIECGLCYMICPEIGELDAEIRDLTAWTAPLGRVDRVVVARAVDPAIRRRATDGGVVTALLLHLLNAGRIDGAVVARKTGTFTRTPCLATTRDEILAAAGFSFETSRSMDVFGGKYATYANSIQALAPMAGGSLEKVAFVGPPCQIKTIRKMKALNIMPADSITCLLGLFCAGNYEFGPQERDRLMQLGKFQWQDVEKINVKEHFMIRLKGGETRLLKLEDLDFMKRYACRFCEDYASEFADISFGGLGAENGWTTALIRTSTGDEIMGDVAASLETYADAPRSGAAEAIINKVTEWSQKKKARAEIRPRG